MNKLEELIEKLCPEGVKFKKLGDVFNIKNGYTPSKAKSEYWTNGKIPWFRMEDIRENGRVLSDSIQHVSEGAVKSGGLFSKDSIIISTTATIGEHALITTPFIMNQQLTALTVNNEYKTKLDPKYAFYYCYIIGDECRKQVNPGGFALINNAKIKKLKIPIPPLPIQEEIVAILDKFTKLEAELEAELEARKTQYEHYRDELLSFENGVEVKSISEICHINRGRVMSKDYLRDNAGSYPVYSSQTANKGVFGLINTYDYDFESVTWTTDGANAGSIFYHNNEKFSITNVCGLLKIKDDISILTKFLYYVLGFTTKIYVSEGMGNPKLMSNAMSRIQIPIPPLPIQEEIVAILDKFDALVNDISVGLPAEIEARRKQYEYYRNKLLTFKEVK